MDIRITIRGWSISICIVMMMDIITIFMMVIVTKV